jgi:hypothetical protein
MRFTRRYSAYVTHLNLAPAEVWRIYRGRGDAENTLLFSADHRPFFVGKWLTNQNENATWFHANIFSIL